jgi:hypothetical protein
MARLPVSSVARLKPVSSLLTSAEGNKASIALVVNVCVVGEIEQAISPEVKMMQKTNLFIYLGIIYIIMNLKEINII